VVICFTAASCVETFTIPQQLQIDRDDDDDGAVCGGSTMEQSSSLNHEYVHNLLEVIMFRAESNI
jgi:hypothetical protein